LFRRTFGKSESKVAEDEGNLYQQDMDTSLKSLEEALSIRRQINSLKTRLASLLGNAAERPSPITTFKRGKRRMLAATKAKLSAAAKARWAKIKHATVGKSARKKGGITPAGRKRLSQLMKARWARKRAARKK
jgi:hypothetical protein